MNVVLYIHGKDGSALESEHYLPLFVSAYFLTKYTSLPPILIYFIVLICGFAGGLILVEIMSRIPFMRWAVLGIKRKSAFNASLLCVGTNYSCFGL